MYFTLLKKKMIELETKLVQKFDNISIDEVTLTTEELELYKLYISYKDNMDNLTEYLSDKQRENLLSTVTIVQPRRNFFDYSVTLHKQTFLK